MTITVKVMLALLPFAILGVGFLVFRLSAVRTALLTWITEMVICLVYYHLSPMRGLEAGLWGGMTMWSAFLLLWSGQLFGHSFRSTGLMQILLDSVESIYPAMDKRCRGLTMIALLSGFVGTFNIYAVYPVAIPGLVDLGFEGIQAAAGYLMYVSWCIPFAGLFIGAVIASTATGVPIADIVHGSGLLSIPLVFLSLFATFRILGLRFADRKNQILYWVISLSNVGGIILFTQVWPNYRALTLMSGAAITVICLLVYRWSKLTAETKRSNALGVSFPTTPDILQASVRSYRRPLPLLGSQGTQVDAGLYFPSPTNVDEDHIFSFRRRATEHHRSDLTSSLSYDPDMAQVREHPYSAQKLLRAYAPLVIAVLYAIISTVPPTSTLIAGLKFEIARWGFSPIAINIFSTPAFPIFVAIAFSYFFRLEQSSALKDLYVGTRRGAPALIALIFSSAMVYLMIETGQINFLASVLVRQGRIAYEFLISGLIFIGGIAFGQGAPAVFLFSRIQISSTRSLGLPLVLLVALANVIAMGPTNSVKPPLIRFTTSLIKISDRDSEVFRLGLLWGLLEVIVMTIILFMLVPIWR